MTYELAKKLKHAGFPQGDELTCGCDEMIKAGIKGKEVFDCEREKVFIPTLSELIDACKELIDKRKTSDFELKNRIYSGGKQAVWGVSLIYLNKRFDEMGNTPEEAVANLWLTVNTATKS